MKKTIAVLLIILNVLMIFGCGKSEVSLEGVYFDKPNYNNVNNSYSYISADGETVFYDDSGFVESKIRVYKDKKSQKILDDGMFSNEYMWGDFFVIEDFAYFATYHEQAQKDIIYRYDLATKTYEKLFITKEIGSWLGTKDYIAFYYFTDDFKYDPNGFEINDLYIYDVKTKAVTLVCKDVVDYGIVNNKIRYLTSDKEGLYNILEYDHTAKGSHKLGETTYISEYYSANYSSDFVTLCDVCESDSITVWSKDGKTAEYTLPSTIEQLIVGEKYAFAVCYEYPNMDGLFDGLVSKPPKNKEAGIYKVDLSNGEYEKIHDADEDTEIYVFSDDIIYIFQNKLNLIGQYKGTLYKFDVTTNESTKLFKQ